MKKIYLLIVISIMLSCSNSKEEINTLNLEIQDLNEKLTMYEIKVENLEKDNSDKLHLLEELKMQLEEKQKTPSFELTNNDFNYKSFLIKEEFSLLPYGFVHTAGYITSMSEQQIREDDNFNINLNYNSLVFFVTDHDSELYSYLEKIQNNDFIYKDEFNNICIPILKDSNNINVSRNKNNPSNVLLTLHRMPNVALEYDVIPFATVFSVKE